MDKKSIITKKSECIEYIESGCKPKSNWKIGTEHEKFLYNRATTKRVGYFGKNGIQAILLAMQERTQMKPMMEGEHIIGLAGENGDSITLEPGGQLELSGAQLDNIHATNLETSAHIKMLLEICEPMNIQIFGLGHDPLYQPDEIEWMPKGRYKIMRRYMPTRGKRGTEMMTMTCTVQVNLDYASESDMVQKFRTSLALQPVISALFANSPLNQGKITGFQTERCAVWQDTDPDRTGFPVCVFDQGFGFEQWVDYLYSVPMYFVYDHGEYLDATGNFFPDFMAGKIDAFKNRPATLKDWDDHLTVAFTEVRLKRYLEMRGADCGSLPFLNALPAVFVGLLYDDEALGAANDIIKKWAVSDMVDMARKMPQHGLKTEIGKYTLWEIAKEVIKIAEYGLNKRAKLGIVAQNESEFLTPLMEICESGITSSDKIVTILDQKYQGDVHKWVGDLSY